MQVSHWDISYFKENKFTFSKLYLFFLWCKNYVVDEFLREKNHSSGGQSVTPSTTVVCHSIYSGSIIKKMWSNDASSIKNGYPGTENPLLCKNTTVLYGILSNIEQLPYLAAILDAILNCENAKRVSLVHPPDSWTSWSKAPKNAKKMIVTKHF